MSCITHVEVGVPIPEKLTMNVIFRGNLDNALFLC